VASYGQWFADLQSLVYEFLKTEGNDEEGLRSDFEAAIRLAKRRLKEPKP
jgi:hypothetical protein